MGENTDLELGPLTAVTDFKDFNTFLGVALLFCQHCMI